MDSHCISNIISHMDLPRHPRRVGLAIAYVLFFASVTLAGANLWALRSTPLLSAVASAVWLALVALVVWHAIRDDRGVRRYLVLRLGEFASRHFAESFRSDQGVATIRFGYAIFSRRLPYCSVLGDGVVSVGWNLGQGSAMTGRDLDDWSVWLVYRTATMPADRPARWKGEDIICIASGMKRSEAEALGEAFVVFLRGSGVRLRPGEGARKYVHSKGGMCSAEVGSDDQTGQ